jgi:beta-lactamase regulating signal transducer with metallopeptidase domain
MMLVRLGVGIARTERMRRNALPLASHDIAERLSQLATKWRLKCVPALGQLDETVVPTVIGVLRPMILLPSMALTIMTPEELDLILGHELAHVRRYDLWVNLLQRVGEAILFFNPSVWYLSRRISTLREYCCDELVCTRQSQTATAIRTRYAAALLRVVEVSRPSLLSDERLAGLAASGGNASELRRRIARLLGEPLREPLRISRGGLVAAALLVGVFAIGLAWTKADAPVATKSDSASSDESQATAVYPPAETDADRVVAAARARTFGTEKKSRLKFRLAYWSSDVKSMRKEKGDSLKLLFEARGKPVDEEQRRYNTLKSTWAWDGDKLFKGEERWEKPAGGGSPSKTWEQARYWDGHEGWQIEGKLPQRNVVRYGELADLFEHGPSSYEFPQIAAAGGRVPWQGPELMMEQQDMSPALARYQLVGSDKIDDVECDVYEGPSRHERVWIDKSRGVVKAVCEYFLQGDVPNYYSEVVRTIAGRTFVDEGEYGEWVASQSAEMKEKLGVFWAVTNFAEAKPGN